jgi:hypothetical protein
VKTKKIQTQLFASPPLLGIYELIDVLTQQKAAFPNEMLTNIGKILLISYKLLSGIISK